MTYMPNVKATVIVSKQEETDRQQSREMKDKWSKYYDSDDIIQPPFDFNDLATLMKMSNMLPQCIQAMSQNCEGFGYNLITEVKGDDKEQLKEEIEEEAEMLNQFFRYISYEQSFTKLRKLMRGDLETFGNGYIEILRRGDGRVDGMEYLKAIDLRLGKLSDRVEFEVKKQSTDSYEYETVDHKKRFRTYVQMIGTDKVYFKEFGDPRAINAADGKEVSEEDRKEAEENDSKIILATEVIHFKIEDPQSVYGIPRWSGNTASVAGSRAAEEVNFLFFDNKAVPPLAITVSGGTMTDNTIKRIKKFIDQEIKGRNNFHKILFLEAEGTPSPNTLEQNRTRIEIKELSQIKDSLFQAYDKDNRQKVRSAFRLPPIYVGLTEEYTRATAKESKEIAEEQVFGPEKQDFDFIINHKIFPDIEVKYHRFETKSAPIESREDQSAIIKEMGESGLTIGEVRKELDRIVEIEMDDLGDQPWLKVPMKLAQFILQVQARGGGEGGGGEGEGEGEGETETAKKRMLAFIKTAKMIRDELRKEGEKEDVA